MVPHAMPKQEKAWFCSPAQSAGERAPESVATPATEVRAPEPTPVAPHERERRSTPPIPAPRVSWRLLLLSSSDTDTYIASESATAIFRFAREVFFFARVWFGSDLSTSKVEGKIGIRRSRPAVDNRVDRDAREGTRKAPRRHSAKAVRVPHARARGSDRGDPQSISGIDASCARHSLEHTAARFRDLVVLASTRARTTGVTRAREPRRFICGDALSSNRRSEARSGDDGLRRGRFETKGASAHRSQ